jgi:homoserine O-succinyltransferase
LPEKCWGVFPHEVVDRKHPLTNDVNTLFKVPHSRFNEITRAQFEAAGLHVLVESPEAGVHLAVSEDLFRIVFFQGHPEYDINSLLKEYKREIRQFVAGVRESYPPFPENYFTVQAQGILDEYQDQVLMALSEKSSVPEFPEALITERLHNTWHDTCEAIINNWIGHVYQTTNSDRTKLFMDGINPDDPLGLRK